MAAPAQIPQENMVQGPSITERIERIRASRQQPVIPEATDGDDQTTQAIRQLDERTSRREIRDMLRDQWQLAKTQIPEMTEDEYIEAESHRLDGEIDKMLAVYKKAQERSLEVAQEKSKEKLELAHTEMNSTSGKAKVNKRYGSLNAANRAALNQFTAK